MRLKLVFIEVEKSRLIKSPSGSINLFDKLHKIRGNLQPIKPVLVGEGEIKEGSDDKYVYISPVEWEDNEKPTIEGVKSLSKGWFDNLWDKKNYHKVITQDTEELYERIASGELVEGCWYEFIENILTGGFREIARPLRLSNNWDVKAETLKVVSEREKIHVVTTYSPEEGVKNYINGVAHPEPNEVTEEITKEDILKDLKGLFDGGDCCFEYVSIENCMKAMDKWAIDRINNSK